MARRTSKSKATKVDVVINSLGEQLLPNEAVDVLHYKSNWPQILDDKSQVQRAWIRGYRVWQSKEANPETGKTTLKKLRPSTRELWKKGSILVYRKTVIARIGDQELRLDSRPTAVAPDRVRRHQLDAISFEEFYSSQGAETKAVSGEGVVLRGVERAEVEDLRLGGESFSHSDEMEEMATKVED